MFLLAPRWGTFHEEERLWLYDRNSIPTMQNLSEITSEVLIGQWSSFIVLAIVYEWQTKDKKPQKSNVNAKNLYQNSQYLWNIVFSRRSIWVSLELIRSNTLPKSTRRNVKLNNFAFENPWLLDLLCKLWFTLSVLNFCCWVTDVPPHETSHSSDEQGEMSAVRRLETMMSPFDTCIQLLTASDRIETVA